MFDLNRRYNWPIVPPIVPPIVDQTCTFESVIPTGDLSEIRSAWSRIAQWVWPLSIDNSGRSVIFAFNHTPRTMQVMVACDVPNHREYFSL